MTCLWKKTGLALCFVVGAAEASAGQLPPRQNLVVARQLVNSVTARINTLIARVQGGGSGGGNVDHCQTIRSSSTCMHTPGCSWYRSAGVCGGNQPRLRINFLSDGVDSSFDDSADDIPENDFAGALALQGMGSGLNALGQSIDLANANYGQASFWIYWQQACNGASNLIIANQGAKVAASLPAQGLISGNDFIPVDQELQAVRTQLWCQ